MGYRSEVAIALTDDATRLLKAIEEHEVFDNLLTEAEGTFPKHLDPEADNWCKLYWGYVKWGNHWPESGEDLEDNEYIGDFYDSEMYITKALQWN